MVARSLCLDLLLERDHLEVLVYELNLDGLKLIDFLNGGAHLALYLTHVELQLLDFGLAALNDAIFALDGVVRLVTLRSRGPALSA
jgi:hypothetical protein